MFRCLLLLCLCLLGGCAAAGAIAYKVAGPPKIDAKYTPAKKATLVLVENYHHQTSAEPDSDLIARYIGDELTSNNVVPLVDLDRLRELRDSRPAEFPKMSVTAIGRAVEAKQVLYVQLQSSDVTPLQGGEALQGSASVIVKLIDADSGKTLWPSDLSDGYPLATSTQLGSTARPSAMDVRERMYHTLADQVAKLFYKWTPEDDRPEEMR